MRHFLTIASLIVGLTSLGHTTVFSGPSFTVPVIHVTGGGGTATSGSFSQGAIVGHSIQGGVASSTNFQINSRFFIPFSSPPPAGSIISVIDPNLDNKLTVTGPAGPITLCIFAGTFTQPITVTLTALSSFAPLTSNVAQLNGTNVGAEFSFSPNETPRKPMIMTIAYRDTDISSLDENRLRISRFIDPQNRWVPLKTTVDQSGNVVSITTLNSGVYQISEMVPNTNVGGVFVYPNPLRPARGHSEMRLTNLPSGATVLILSVRGDRVREVVADVTGQATWDGKNEDGRGVASGVYLAHIRHGGSNQTIKIAVER